jgi:hypothetical protein
MDNNFVYYLFVLIALVAGIIVVKKVTSCLIKTIALLVIIGMLVLLYCKYMA